jgi:hypothetical protein
MLAQLGLDHRSGCLTLDPISEGHALAVHLASLRQQWKRAAQCWPSASVLSKPSVMRETRWQHCLCDRTGSALPPAPATNGTPSLSVSTCARAAGGPGHPAPARSARQPAGQSRRHERSRVMPAGARDTRRVHTSDGSPRSTAPAALMRADCIRCHTSTTGVSRNEDPVGGRAGGRDGRRARRPLGNGSGHGAPYGSRGWEDRERVRTSPRLRRGVALGAQPALGFVRPMVLLIDMSAIAPAGTAQAPTGTAQARGGPGPGRCFTV